jgi:hypothetical protein
MLGRTTNVADELATLAKRLDDVYRSTAETLADNSAVQIETVDGKAELKLSPLEKLEEPASLRTLRTKNGAADSAGRFTRSLTGNPPAHRVC